MAAHSAGPRALVSPQGRAAREDSADHDALNGASQDCTDGTEPPHVCAAREKIENRTEHSIRAENAARVLRPLRKARVVVSTELDAAMTELEISNVAVARHLGVNEKTVREWRGQGLLPGEVPKAIPFCVVLELPDRLRLKMLGLGNDIMARDRQAARERAAR